MTNQRENNQSLVDSAYKILPKRQLAGGAAENVLCGEKPGENNASLPAAPHAPAAHSARARWWRMTIITGGGAHRESEKSRGEREAHRAFDR